MTKEELHKKTKQFVYQLIMAFKSYKGDVNEALITQIVQSATRMSAFCRDTSDTRRDESTQSELYKCNDLLNEVLYLLSLLENSKTRDIIKTETIILEAVELKQIVKNLCDKTITLVEV
ncbi:MAG: hypothetical protein DRJ10_08555 [Bacteroidetes bacterium]|nr:MAG: hypothetical protein DRJ07_16405 [Bacteroidota bacterium]RLD79641.1 MAG: hypothetical protein DRJ10_08555 [Bacteroidota bacterium]